MSQNNVFLGLLGLAVLSALGSAGCNGSSSTNPAGPSVHPTATPIPVSATVQTLWKDGSLASQWWGQNLTATSHALSEGTIQNAAVSDALTGDTTSLAFVSNGFIQSGPTGGVYFNTGQVNASGYSTVGHLQFDLCLGPAFSSANTIVVQYGNGTLCQTTLNLTGVGTGTFSHLSLPFNGGFGTCDETGTFSGVLIGIPWSGPGDVIAAGVQFYINDVQITPN